MWDAGPDALAAAGIKPFLLHGVTGSGKTEIYLRAIEEVVRQGKEAIVLVPEISLTPQTIARFRGRCGERRGAAQPPHRRRARRPLAARSRAGRCRSSSAPAAPSSPRRASSASSSSTRSTRTRFKQETTPRYHARDVAVMRARLENIPILLGSATPSLESWHNAAARPVHAAELPQRVEDRPMPHGEARSTCATSRSRPASASAIGPTLERAMRDALEGRRPGDPAAQPPRVSARTSTARRAATSRSASTATWR